MSEEERMSISYFPSEFLDRFEDAEEVEAGIQN